MFGVWFINTFLIFSKLEFDVWPRMRYVGEFNISADYVLTCMPLMLRDYFYKRIKDMRTSKYVNKLWHSIIRIERNKLILYWAK